MKQRSSKPFEGQFKRTWSTGDYVTSLAFWQSARSSDIKTYGTHVALRQGFTILTMRVHEHTHTHTDAYVTSVGNYGSEPPHARRSVASKSTIGLRFGELDAHPTVVNPHIVYTQQP